jgi:hypothetical protein
MTAHRVPMVSQTTEKLCWEACGRMLWLWHHKKILDYSQRAGHFATMNAGLTEDQMDVFYKQLGLRSLEKPRGANVVHALGWTPVIVTSVDEVSGHAFVVSGFDGRNRTYDVVNPSGRMVVNFDTDSNVSTASTATVIRLATHEVDSKLGSRIWYW